MSDESNCPLCGDDSVCPGEHCLIELESVLQTVRDLKKSEDTEAAVMWNAALKATAEALLDKFGPWGPSTTEDQ